MNRTHRIQLRLVLFALAFGFAVNIGVAWLTALRVGKMPYPLARTDALERIVGTQGKGGNWLVSYQWSAFVDRVALDAVRIPLRGDFNPRVGSSLEFASDEGPAPAKPPPRWNEVPVASAPAWVRILDGDEAAQFKTVFTFGWPIRCLFGESLFVQRSGKMAIEARGWWTIAESASPTRLPLLPIWPGLIANTVIYACACAGMIWALGARRRRSRRQRGHCPMCNYDLKAQFESGCPECGWDKAEAPTK